MGVIATFVCDLKPQEELEAQLAEWFEQMGVITIYEIEGPQKIGFYELPNNNGAFNTIFKREDPLTYEGEEICGLIGAGDMDEKFDGMIRPLLSHLRAEYDK